MPGPAGVAVVCHAAAFLQWVMDPVSADDALVEFDRCPVLQPITR
jgi:hypothetical protein